MKGFGAWGVEGLRYRLAVDVVGDVPRGEDPLDGRGRAFARDQVPGLGFRFRV